MNILISCLGYDKGKSGISSYMRNAIKNFPQKKYDKITLVVDEDDSKDFEGFALIKVSRKFSKGALNMLWHLFVLPKYLKSRRFDCLIVFAGNRRYIFKSEIPTIAVIHDLSQYRVENKYDFLRMFYLKRIQPFLVKKYDNFIAISESTKSDMEKYWNVDASKITLNYNGLNRLEGEDEKIFQKLNLQKYILYVSRLEYPGKNHLGLIKAFESMPENLKSEFKLVLVGQDWNGADEIKNFAKNSHEKNKIIFTGYVTDKELSSLYEKASVFVFPSFSEGFGLPLVEAMSRGIPCAVANNSSLPEIGGEAVLSFDPSNVEEITNSISRILSNEKLRIDLSNKGLERAKAFDWKNHSDKIYEIVSNSYLKFKKLNLFDIPFNNQRQNEILFEFDEILKSQNRKSVGFINAHYLNIAYADKNQTERLKSFDYILPDGSGVSIACRIMGFPYRDNLNGTDLFPKLCELSEKNLYSIFLFGSKEGVAKKVAERFKKIFPNLKVAGTRNGFFKECENEKIISEINASACDILFIGFGAPMQEKWMYENFHKLNAKLVLTVGGLFDPSSDDKTRPSPIFRKLGLEWFGRLIKSPRLLFKRYVLGNPLFIARVLKEKFFTKNS